MLYSQSLKCQEKSLMVIFLDKTFEEAPIYGSNRVEQIKDGHRL